ncbi:MAG: hypothetical protein PWQ67_1074 [Clostridia bacterium]|nr:hypothetical protein [Clostridia bacterium]
MVLLVHNQITTRLFFEAFRAGLWALEHSSDLNIPLLLMHGTADGITSYEASREFYQNTTCDCTFKLWEGKFHELHNEIDKEKVYNVLVDWLKRKI